MLQLSQEILIDQRCGDPTAIPNGDFMNSVLEQISNKLNVTYRLVWASEITFFVEVGLFLFFILFAALSDCRCRPSLSLPEWITEFKEMFTIYSKFN